MENLYGCLSPNIRKYFLGQTCYSCKYVTYYKTKNNLIYMCTEPHRMEKQHNFPNKDDIYSPYIERDERDCCEYWERI